MLTKLFKTVNISTLVVVVVSLSISIYTIVMYRSFLSAERQDIAYMKEQIASLSNAVQSLLNIQQQSLESKGPASFLPPEIMNMFTSAMASNDGEDCGPEVLINEKFVPQRTAKESNKPLQEQTNNAQNIEKTTTNQTTNQTTSHITSHMSMPFNAASEVNEVGTEENEDNQSTSSEDTHRLISSMIIDEDNDDEEEVAKDAVKDAVKDEKEEPTQQKEEQEQQQEEDEEEEEVFTPEINHLLNAEKQRGSDGSLNQNQNQNIEEFILGHLSESEKSNKSNIESEVKSVEDAPRKYPTEDELNTWRYEKLRQYIKTEFHVSVSKGTKAELVAKVLELSAQHSQ